MLFIIQNLHIIQIALDDAEKVTSEPQDTYALETAPAQ